MAGLNPQTKKNLELIAAGKMPTPVAPGPTTLQQWGADPSSVYNNTQDATNAQNQNFSKNLGAGLGGLAKLFGGHTNAQTPPPASDPGMPNAPAGPAAPKPFVDPNAAMNPQAQGFKGALANASANANASTGFDINKHFNFDPNKPPEAHDSRGASQAVYQPTPEKKPIPGPNGTTIDPSNPKEGLASAWKTKDDAVSGLKNIIPEYDAWEKATPKFEPSVHHPTDGSKIAAGITLLLGALLGPKSGLGSGLLQGLTNTVQQIHTNNNEQYEKELQEYNAKLAQHTAQGAAIKDKATVLGQVLQSADKSITAVERAENDQVKWKQFDEKFHAQIGRYADLHKEALARNGISAERLNELIDHDGAMEGVAQMNAASRAKAVSLTARYQMANVFLRAQSNQINAQGVRNADPNIKQALSELDAQHKFIDDGLKNINTQFTSKQITAEQRDDKINQFWAQYSPKLQDAINRADSLGANTQEFASTMDAEASATWNPDTEDSNLEDKVLDPNTGLMVDNPAKRHTAPTFQAGGGSSTIPPHPGQPPHSDGQGPVKHAAAPVPGGDTMHILKDLGYDYGDGGDATPAHKDDKPHVNSTPTPQPHDNKHGVPAKPPVKLTGGGWGDDGGTAKSGLKAKLGSAPSSSASMPAGLTQGQVDQFKRLSPADQQATLNDTQHVTPEMRAYLQQFASKK